MNHIVNSLFLILLGISGVAYSDTQKESLDDVIKRVTSSLHGSASKEKRIVIENAEVKLFNLQDISKKENELTKELCAIVNRDLMLSGNFLLTENKLSVLPTKELLKANGIQGFYNIYDVSSDKDAKSAKVAMFDLTKMKEEKKDFTGKDLLSLGHEIAKNIHKQLLWENELYSLEIFAVERQNKKSYLVRMDFDGNNKQILFETIGLINSPSLRSDKNSKEIIFSLTTTSHSLEILSLENKKLKRAYKSDGLSLDPKFINNTDNILATISKANKADIYILDQRHKKLTPVTKSFGSNLSGCLNKDGNRFLFVSERSGNPQIYESTLKEPEKALRLTFIGNYNQTPVYSPDDLYIAFTGRSDKNKLDVFLLNRKKNIVTRVTDIGQNSEPGFSKDSTYIFFISERDGHGREIYVSNLTGTHQARITNGGGFYSPIVQINN